MINTTAPVVNPTTTGRDNRYATYPARTNPIIALKTPTMSASSAASLM